MTFLGYHAEFSKHDLAGHPENHRRAQAILDHVASKPDLRSMVRLEPDRPLTDEEILRVHSRRLLLALQAPAAAPVAWLDPDTYLTPASERCARLAARLSVEAALRALGRGESGFVVARPPGHHATRDRSMGFCLLNNVALAAQAALESTMARRVLIFDHDVHHGNGTQEIFWEDPRVVYQSFHLGAHYPGTGAIQENGGGPKRGHILNAPLESGDGDPEVRSLLEHVFLPVARAFRPDLVLMSAGFDSLAGDPLGGLDLTPPFFGEIVARFRRVCPRIVACLEGGYQIDRIPIAVEAQLRAMNEEPVPVGQEVKAPKVEPQLLEIMAGAWPNVG